MMGGGGGGGEGGGGGGGGGGDSVVMGVAVVVTAEAAAVILVELTEWHRLTNTRTIENMKKGRTDRWLDVLTIRSSYARHLRGGIDS